MNLLRLKKVIENRIKVIESREESECTTVNKWNVSQWHYFNHRLDEVKDCYYNNKDCSNYVELIDMINSWKESEYLTHELDYVYEIDKLPTSHLTLG